MTLRMNNENMNGKSYKVIVKQSHLFHSVHDMVTLKRKQDAYLNDILPIHFSFKMVKKSLPDKILPMLFHKSSSFSFITKPWMFLNAYSLLLQTLLFTVILKYKDATASTCSKCTKNNLTKNLKKNK